MKPLLPNQKIDLVDFRELRLFMFEEDNLYKIGVPENRRKFPLETHYAEMAEQGFLRCPMTAANVEQNSESRYFFHQYLWHWHKAGRKCLLFDIGAFIGDFALHLASFARTAEIPFNAVCFDPSIAGTLIPYNISCNKLESYVKHEDLAVSTFDGPVKFSSRIGHLDSASIGEGEGFEYLVNSVSLATYLRNNPLADDTHLIVKIDTEGHEAGIIVDLLAASSIPPTIIFEFTPTAQTNRAIDMNSFFAELGKYYEIFDVSHLPHASRVREVKLSALDHYFDAVHRRQSGYADVLLIPKEIPNFSSLLKQIQQLEHGQKGLYDLVASKLHGSD